MLTRPFPNRYTRFLSHVNTHGFNPDSCWEWLGAGKGNGYGNARVGSQNITAHSRAYQLFVGEIPQGMEVCHTCDNRFCVNPDHLFVGTRKTNMEDCVAKGRTEGGNRKHLKEATIQEVRRRISSGLSASQIAKSMDLNYATVTAIKAGRSYVRKSK